MLQLNLPDTKYLWRFFDLYKFISFLNTKEIIFCRLDQFEDSMETCSEEMAFWLTNDLSIAEIPQSQRNPMLKPEVFQEKGIEFIQKLNTLKHKQKRCFASCFYAADEESIAMWKLYGGIQGVAIKFDSVELFNALNDVYNKTLNDKMEFGGNKMNYLNLININPYTETGEIVKLDQDYSPYNKDISYRHENEYRFILINTNPDLIDSKNKSLKIDLDDRYLEFIVSPDTEQWKKDLLNQLINKNGYDKTISNSRIITKEVVTKHKLHLLDNILGDFKLPGRTFTKFYR